jgi:hypothetical protein
MTTEINVKIEQQRQKSAPTSSKDGIKLQQH